MNEDNNTKSKEEIKEEKEAREKRLRVRTKNALLLTATVILLSIILFSTFQRYGIEKWFAFGYGFVILFSAITVGTLLGFLFGLPKSSASAKEKKNATDITELSIAHNAAKEVVLSLEAKLSVSTTLEEAKIEIKEMITATKKDVEDLELKISKAGVNKIIDINEQNTKEKHLTNSNLEEVSGWLTKIIVGLGLTQLTDLPHQLKGSPTL